MFANNLSGKIVQNGGSWWVTTDTHSIAMIDGQLLTMPGILLNDVVIEAGGGGSSSDGGSGNNLGFSFYTPEVNMVAGAFGGFTGTLSNLAERQSKVYKAIYGSALESATDITANNRAYFANLSKGAGRLATGLSIMTTAYSLNSAFDQFNAGGLDEVF